MLLGLLSWNFLARLGGMSCSRCACTFLANQDWAFFLSFNVQDLEIPDLRVTQKAHLFPSLIHICSHSFFHQCSRWKSISFRTLRAGLPSTKADLALNSTDFYVSKHVVHHGASLPHARHVTCHCLRMSCKRARESSSNGYFGPSTDSPSLS